MDGRTGCLWLVTNKYARDETIRKHTVLKTIPERYSFSLVWQAKVKGRKTFSALSH
jgi:hypothetical protein